VLAERFCLGQLWANMCHREPLCCGIHGRMADGNRAAKTVGITGGCFTDGTDGPWLLGRYCLFAPGAVGWCVLALLVPVIIVAVPDV
jgi:hypothetical protein